MLRIKAICLGHKENFTGNYQSIEDLKTAVREKYHGYLVKKNVKETRINFILTYMNEITCKEELLEDINIIKRHDGQWFEVSVKRIWDACCACLSSFSITPDRIPCECQTPDCGYQYCNDCVQVMKRSNRTDRKIFCMYCGTSSLEGPIQNKLLIDLLWDQYMIKYGISIFQKPNIMPIILSNDIECRIIHLKSLIQTLERSMSQTTSNWKSFTTEIQSATTLIINLEKIKEKIDKFFLTINDDIDDNKVNECSQEYLKILTGDRDDSQICEHFICICEQLLYHHQKAEFEKYFPLLNNKMNEWEQTLIEEQFQPKIIEVFKAVESGLGNQVLPAIPCRVGFIGNISVGKTSLLNWLRDIRNNNNILASPVRVGKSTYCRLEFEHEYDQDKKVVFVDIEGSTDTDMYLKSANYYDEIIKADCDLYILVFDNQFTDIQKSWYDYIVKDLQRQCWLVRSKVDQLFRPMFKENIGQDFDSATDSVKDKFGKRIIDQIRNEVSIDIHGRELSNVYLTFTLHDENLSKLSYSNDDLEKLLHDIKNLPLNLYGNRLQTVAVRAVTRVINTCFRRGYVVNIMKYKVAAGIAAVVPFFDLIPRYYGREEIRQAFGVNTNSRLINWLYGTTDEFKDYLGEFDICIDESALKTSAFNKTFRKKPVIMRKTAKQASSIVIKGATAAGVVGASVTDDVIRGVGVGTVAATRVLSASLIIVGGVLTAAMCAWAAVSNGKQMYKYLNKLCDDLIIVSHYVTAKVIEDNDTIRDYFTTPELEREN